MINLEHWVGQEVLVTYRNGTTGSYKVERHAKKQDYYLIDRLTYTIDGIQISYSQFDIIKIEPINKIAHLKRQIQELQAELEKLENVERVPEGFDTERAYKFLNGDETYGLDANYWGKNTKEGEDYWMDISVGNKKPTDKDIIQLQKWIIESYREQLGL